MAARKVSGVELLKLYNSGFSASGIARLKGVSRQYVSRELKALRLSDPTIFTRDVSDVRYGPDGVKNVHAQRIRAFVHFASDKYKKAGGVQFKDFVAGVDVSCAGKFIYLRARRKFGGDTESKALWSSLGFWSEVITKLEQRLGVIIFKKGAQAFEFLYQEYETRDSVVALDAEKKGHIWRVYHNEDGKLRLSVDWSDKQPNHETHHYRDANSDSVVFEKHINSILDAGVGAPSYTELVSLVRDIAVHNRETAVSLTAVTEVLKSQFPKREEFVDGLAGVKPSYCG